MKTTNYIIIKNVNLRAKMISETEMKQDSRKLV